MQNGGSEQFRFDHKFASLYPVSAARFCDWPPTPFKRPYLLHIAFSSYPLHSRRSSMRQKPVRISLALFCLTAVLGVARFVKAADTLPSQYTDAEFWRMVTDFSEPGGDYQFENFVSNEISYQEVIPELSRLAKAGGVYLGVASEQNFTYIDVVRPKVAFIFDVRRQNTLQLLMYKALFEMADNRADFVSLLFSRKR